MAIQSQIKMMQHQESQATAASPAELNGLLPESYKRVLNQAETTSHELNEFLSSLSEQENMEVRNIDICIEFPPQNNLFRLSN